MSGEFQIDQKCFAKEMRKPLKSQKIFQESCNNTMAVMLCTGATFVKINSCLVPKIVSFDTAGLHLPTFRILDTTHPKILSLISVTLSHINDVNIVPSN